MPVNGRVAPILISVSVTPGGGAAAAPEPLSLATFPQAAASRATTAAAAIRSGLRTIGVLRDEGRGQAV